MVRQGKTQATMRNLRNARHERAPGKPGGRGARPSGPAASGAPGETWLWTSREGFEGVLRDELQRGGVTARVVEPGVVESQGAPEQAPAFARVGFEVLGRTPADAARPADVARSWPGPVHLQAWVPDTAAGNRASARVRALCDQVVAARREGGLTSLATAAEAQGRGVGLAQLVLLAGGDLVYGSVSAVEALSTAPGGRSRVKRPGAAPSRAAMKLEEALASLANEPGPGDVCVDLGAAPGGWTERLLVRRARVIAVDPANMSPTLRGHRGLRHVKDSAFRFRPEEPVDWLLCDMAWRPLEVAQMLGRWGQQRWARQLVANIKLPMKDKLPIVARVRDTLAQAGWRGLLVRQLYHDRDEVTVTAYTG